ncbi:MAG: hypothetical protein JXA43_02090 [Candidatus Diapherotrites archaeon]|nr:hypothetical protein [Candidatus Diapherotrites archaeon]
MAKKKGLFEESDMPWLPLVLLILSVSMIVESVMPLSIPFTVYMLFMLACLWLADEFMKHN